MPERRMAIVAIAFAIGIIAADYLTVTGCALIIASITLSALLFAPKQHRTTLILIAALVICGAMRYAADRSIASDDISHFTRSIKAFEGKVASDMDGSPESARVTFRVDHIKLPKGWRRASGNVMLNIYSNDSTPSTKLEYGDRVRILVQPYMPFEPTNPGQFSWKNYLARHGIYTCASVRDADQIEIINHSKSIVGVALAARQYIVSAIYRVHSPQVASVMSGVALGTYSYLDDETLTSFTRTGTLHVLAASGYNCFVLMFFAVPMLKLFRIIPKYRNIIVIVLIGIYLLMIGPVPSFVRAAVMASLVLLAVPLKRAANYANIFYVAAFVELIYNPSNIFDIGFQLSFLAVWALIVAAPVIEALLKHTAFPELKAGIRLKERNKPIYAIMRMSSVWLGRELASVFVGTIAVSLVTGPIIAYYFHYISLTTLPANLAVALLVPVVFFDSFLSTITALAPHCAGFIGFVGTVSTRTMLDIVGYLGSIKYSSVSIQSPGILGILGYYLILYTAAVYVRSRFAEK